MLFPAPLAPARLERRYKRFLADCILDETGEAITASVPNTGSMMGLTTPGSRVYLSQSDDPSRKYAHRLELVEADDTLVGINTGMPNKLAEEAIAKGLAGDLGRYPHLARERKYGTNSRVDIVLGEADGQDDVYVEVKNVHLMRKRGLAEFPDSKTSRGVKHLGDLAEMVNQGKRAVMLFVIQRADCDGFAICGDLDPTYMNAFKAAREAGVEAMAVGCKITPAMIEPVKAITILEGC